VDERPEQQMMIDRVADEHGRTIDFRILADPDHAVIDRYGLFNAESRRPVPHPAVYVIDKEGAVRWKFIEVDYRIRPTNEAVMAALAEIG
jgi:peroxiredoxin